MAGSAGADPSMGCQPQARPVCTTVMMHPRYLHQRNAKMEHYSPLRLLKMIANKHDQIFCLSLTLNQKVVGEIVEEQLSLLQLLSVTHSHIQPHKQARSIKSVAQIQTQFSQSLHYGIIMFHFNSK